MPDTTLPMSYGPLLTDLKARIHASRMRATLAVNQELILFYWDLGEVIVRRQTDEGWGAQVIGRLSTDLRSAFPDMKGFSPRNLRYMKQFCESWPTRAIVQEVLAKIPWSTNLACWRSSTTRICGDGTPSRRSRTAGRAPCWSCRYRAGCIAVRARR